MLWEEAEARLRTVRQVLSTRETVVVAQEVAGAEALAVRAS